MHQLMAIFRTSLFTRIVPTMKEIGLWGPRVGSGTGPASQAYIGR
jgi:hypothetical protein